MIRTLRIKTAANVMLLMTLASDHVSGAAGKTLAITASKNGAAFSGIAPVVTDLGSGWYSLALTAAMTDTAGDLAMHVTAASCDPTDMLFNVDAFLTEKMLRNKRVLDPTTGIETIYDDDNATPLFTRPVWEDAAGTTPYRDQGADRVDRYT